MTAGWERLAAFEGGSIEGLTVSLPSDRSPHVFAATLVGVYRSDDGGRNWKRLAADRTLAGVETLAAAEVSGKATLYVGGERDGLFRWQDGQWDHLLADARVLTVACLPIAASPNTILVGTEQDGILISRDNGKRWVGANAGLLDLTVFALALEPDFESRGTAFAATATGLYRTRNGAESWRDLELEWEWEGVAFQCLAVSPGYPNDRLVLAGTEAHGILRSDDAGRTWEQSAGLAGLSILDLTFSDEGQIAAATDAGVALSSDGGSSWRLVGTELGLVRCIRFVPEDDGETLVAGLPGDGIVRSTDGGMTWEASNAGLQATLVLGHALSPGFDEDATIFAAVLPDGVKVSRDGGRTWNEQNDGLADRTVLEIVPSPRLAQDQTVFATTDAGLFVSRDGAATWNPAMPDQPPVPAVSVAVAPGRPNGPCQVVTARERGALLVSEDGGVSWQSRPVGWQGSDAIAVVASPALSHDGTLYVVTRPPQVDQHTVRMAVWRTADRGRHWEAWLTLPDVTGGTAVRVVALPENRFGDTVVVGLESRVLRPRQGSWERTGGTRRPVWDEVELPGSDPAGRLPALTSLAASPDYAHDRTVFAASSAGVYVSRDGGASFTAWNEGLEPLATVAVAPSPAYARDRLVYGLGLGGTVWRRRDE